MLPFCGPFVLSTAVGIVAGTESAFLTHTYNLWFCSRCTRHLFLSGCAYDDLSDDTIHPAIVVDDMVEPSFKYLEW